MVDDRQEKFSIYLTNYYYAAGHSQPNTPAVNRA